MLFNSCHFVIFFGIIFYTYFLLPHKARLYLLLAASYYFYMAWRADYAILLIISTVTDYAASWLIYRHPGRLLKKTGLMLSLIVNLGLLIVFKYYNFFIESLAQISNHLPLHFHLPQLDVLLPVGISFYTFQTLEYTIDVYREQIKPEANFFRFAVYVSFFPQLVAGPIERAGHLLPQLHREVRFDYVRIKSGFILMLWGYFQKVVIADRLAVFVNAVYNHPEQASGMAIPLATLFFAFQIYCDFSGYTNIARGSARILGFDLMENFNKPYFAVSIRDFWRRWHISLTTWFKDYLYIPLGGNRKGPGRFMINVMLVFLISGLWHGANWTFILWGATHGLLYLTEHVLSKRITRPAGGIRSTVCRILSYAYTFTAVCVTWLLFRANSVGDITTLIRNTKDNFFSLASLQVQDGLSMSQIKLSIGLIVLLLFVDSMNFSDKRAMHIHPVLRWVSYVVFIWSILLLGVFDNELATFIYFQF